MTSEGSPVSRSSNDTTLFMVITLGGISLESTIFRPRELIFQQIEHAWFQLTRLRAQQLGQPTAFVGSREYDVRPRGHGRTPIHGAYLPMNHNPRSSGISGHDGAIRRWLTAAEPSIRPGLDELPRTPSLATLLGTALAIYVHREANCDGANARD